MSPSRISAFLLDLHERSTELGYRELQHHAFRKLNELIPFDAGLMGMGTIQQGVPHGHDVVLDRCAPGLMESWQEIKHEDRVALWAFHHPGETGSFAVDGPIFDGCEAARAHCKRWGIAHVMCTSQISAKVGLYWVLSTYRTDASRAFSELERETMQLVVPHMVAAARRARIGHLRVRTRVADGHGQAAAIANAEGLVLEAEPGFAELLAKGWPGWGGPTLPREVVAELAAGKPARLAKKQVILRSDRADGVILLHVRRAVPADRLTSREREIAEGFSLGETHRELSDRLGLAPNTVRRHLQNIYEKLGISSKVELDRMLSSAR
ncbi:MAG TPA: LuxR C-terminal-related transcriptional regulator [Kofleriaceae bacterium]|nr:LuxR C-terminal-related transcriptional regulator [Kofleriaceae bacterium]